MPTTLTGLAQYTGSGTRAVRFTLPDGQRSIYVSGDYNQALVTPEQFRALKQIAPADFLMIPAVLILDSFTLSNPTIYISSLAESHRRKLLDAGLDTVGRVLADKESALRLINGAQYGDIYVETFGIDEPPYEDFWLESLLAP